MLWTQTYDDAHHYTVRDHPWWFSWRLAKAKPEYYGTASFASCWLRKYVHRMNGFSQPPRSETLRQNAMRLKVHLLCGWRGTFCFNIHVIFHFVMPLPKFEFATASRSRRGVCGSLVDLYSGWSPVTSTIPTQRANRWPDYFWNRVALWKFTA